MSRKSVETIQATTTVDDVVRMAIEDLFPDQTIPDENNYLPNGQQHKAPDHAILDGNVLIERKSRNGLSEKKVQDWFDGVSDGQDERIFAYGTQSLKRLIEQLPDPDRANLRMTDLLLRQSLKSVTEARTKFEEHAHFIDNTPRLRIVILSDNTEVVSANDFEEAYFGRKMGGYSVDADVTGLIDAIVLVRHPKLTLDGSNSFWFKCLIKKRIAGPDYETMRRVVDSLYYRLSRYGEFMAHLEAFKFGRYTPIIV